VSRGSGAQRSTSVVSAGILLGLAVGVFGVSFGLIAVTAGLSPAKACAMSLLVFTGASQFAAVGVVGAGGSPVAAIASALFLGARNAAYGLTMAPVLHGRLPKRLLAAQLVIDESTALAMAQSDHREQQRGFWAAGVGIYVFWNIGTLVGALGGQLIGKPETWGLDAAFPAAFVALLIPHLRKVGGKQTALLGAALALFFTPILPPGIPILVAAVASVVGLRRRTTP
jgi:4-azaleucine resistance transporter AzlC